MLSLDTRFHLDHATGSLSRVLERGSRAVYIIFRSLVFTFLPTLLELALVCAVLARSFNINVALTVLGCFVAYCAFTIRFTMDVAERRKVVNMIENRAGAATVDALLNIETVTVFDNVNLEVRTFNKNALAQNAANFVAEKASAMLNAGQVSTLGKKSNPNPNPRSRTLAPEPSLPNPNNPRSLTLTTLAP